MENNNLSSALARAQATMGVAGKTGYNSRFKTRFSSLNDLVKASRESLTREGLSVTQFLDQTGDDLFIVTQLRHSSGEMVPGRVKIYLQNPEDFQKIGGAMTHLRRYCYESICGIVTAESDDDASYLYITSDSTTRYSKISEEQYIKIRGLLEGTPEEYEKELCEYYKIPSMRELPYKYLNEVIGVLGGE